MKKLLLAIAVLTLVIGASSCNKQKKCQCTYTTGSTVTTGDVFLTEEGKTCADYEGTLLGVTDVECHRVF